MTIEMLSPLVMIPGTGLGYRSPLAMGSLGVHLPVPGAARSTGAPSDWCEVSAALAAALGVPVNSGSAATTPEARLVDDLLALALAVQQSARVPLFECGRTVHCHAQNGPMWRVDFVMPWVLAKPAQLALGGLIETADWLLARRAGQAAERPVDELLTTELRERMARLQARLKPHRLPGNNTFRFLTAAHAMDIPSHLVVANVFAFGQGRHQRWMDSSFTDRTSVLGTALVRQKHLAAAVLRANGFPVAEHHLAADADAAVRVATDLGYPVVVKPADLDGGVGVAANLRDEAGVRTAYAHAARHSSRILIERHVHGQDIRLTVVHGRMIKAVHRVPGGVLGDGVLPVAALVDQANRLPRRMKRNQDRAATLLQIDDEARAMLGELGLSPEHVPAPGEFIALRRRANVSSGGEPILVTDRVHPDNQRLAERAARTLRLDMAGVDMIIGDISRSWLETGAWICEVNAQPQIGDGTTPQIYAEILRGLLTGDARIPVVLVIEGDAAMHGDCVARQLQQAFEARGLRCARASRAGVWLGGGVQPLCPAGDWFKAARVVSDLQDAGAAVVLASAIELQRSGLPFDRLQAVVLSGAEPSAAGQSILQGVLQMALPNVTGNLVIDADHPLLPWLRARVDAARLSVVDAVLGDDPVQRSQRLATAALPEPGRVLRTA